MSLSNAFFAIIKRDLVLALRRRSEIANPLLFFVLVITLFPLGIGAQPHLLQAIAPGIIWVSALLAAMLSLDSLFRSDFDDGSLVVSGVFRNAYPFFRHLIIDLITGNAGVKFDWRNWRSFNRGLTSRRDDLVFISIATVCARVNFC